MSFKKDYISEILNKWEAPDKNDARLLGMPIIPPPLFFQAPRNFMGPTAWNKMRKACYEKAGYKCEICGYQGTPGKRDYSAHEVYSIDYTTGTSTFIRPVCLCPRCHLLNIHVSRAFTEYKHGNPIYSAEKMLEGAEHGFKVIAEWNKSHSEKIKKHSAMLDWLKPEELREPMIELIKKYEIEFYGQPGGKFQAAWGDWKLVYNGKEYRTPYKSQEELNKVLKKTDKKINRFEMTERMKGGIFDEVDKIIGKEK